MIVTKKDVLDRIIDLKNITVFGEWMGEVYDIANKKYNKDKKYNIDLEIRSVITDTFWLGFVCFPKGWTTEPKVILKDRLKKFKKHCKPILQETNSKSFKEINKDAPRVLNILKRYYRLFIEASTDSGWHGYRRFKNNNLSSSLKKKYLNNYLKLLNSYEDEKIPLWPTCKEIRLVIWSMFN